MPTKQENYTAIQAIKDIVTSDKYLERPRGESTGRAIAATALALADYDPSQNDEVYRDEVALKQIVIGLMSDAYQSQVELNQHRSSMHPSEVGKHLDNVIDYNHALRELVDHNPKTDFRSIMAFVAEAANTLYSDPRDVEDISEQVRMRLDGMRNEVAVESMLWRIPGVVDVRSATRAEDKRGIDVVAVFEDGQTLKLDVKASERSADEANQKTHRPRAVWSGLNWEDFDGKLRIDEREISQHVPKFEEQLAKLRTKQDQNRQAKLAKSS